MIWLGVAALVLVVVELLAAGVGVVMLRRLWRQAEPQVRPLLSMFAPPAIELPPDRGAIVHAPDCAIYDEQPCDCTARPQ